MSEWKPIETAPKDGTVFDVLCRSKDGVEITVPELKYGHAPMDKSRMILWGSQNFLSPYLEPISWRPRDLPAPPEKDAAHD